MDIPNNIWMHRISHCMELSHPLLEKHNLLPIGYSDFSGEGFIEQCRNDWGDFNKSFKDAWGFVPRNRHSLWKFLYQMKAGDWVLVPSWGCFHIYEVLEDNPMRIPGLATIDGLTNWHKKAVEKKENGLLYKGDQLYDLGFVRRVKLITRDVSRKDYADAALTARLKSRNSTSNITDLKESVIEAFNSHGKKTPINLYSQVIDKLAQSLLTEVKKQLKPDKFERLVKLYMEKSGTDQCFIPAKNETDKTGDDDVIATYDAIRTTIYVQCKFHDGKTGSHAVRQVIEYKEFKTVQNSSDDGMNNLAWVITSADSFCEESNKLAAEHGVQLITGLQFAEMLLNVGISGLSAV